MNQPKSFKTIQQRIRTELIERRSRFIATASPVKTKEGVVRLLSDLRQEFPDASHHCYAYRLAPDGLQYKFFDDGEPSGTAGKPILLCLQRKSLVNTLVVVTRYFGGVKLGAGPLARAYGESANLVLDKADIITEHPTMSLRVFTPYEDIRVVRETVERFSDEFTEEFGDIVFYSVSIRMDQYDEFVRQLTEVSQGRAGCTTS